LEVGINAHNFGRGLYKYHSTKVLLQLVSEKKIKVYDVRRTPSDGKSSHGLWPGELKRKLRKQAKHYVSKDNLLYYVSAKGETRRVVRKTGKHRILRACHSDSIAGKYIFYVFLIPSQTLHGITRVIVF
jgi:hypothetical protein